MHNARGEQFDRYIGHHVVDRDEEVIGKLSSLWTDESGQLAYLGVKTGWFSSKLHVIPAYAAQLDARRERIRVPFREQAVKDAPAFDPDTELSGADERCARKFAAIEAKLKKEDPPRERRVGWRKTAAAVQVSIDPSRGD